MLFRQIRAADGVQCTYVVGDVERGWAVVVDPVPSAARRVGGLLERHQLELRAVLETGVRAEPPQEAHSRFSEMIRLLGADAELPEPGGPTPWDGIERGGPIEPWSGAAGDASVPRALFSWQGRMRELCARSAEVFDPLRDTLGLQFGAAVLRIGETELLALPVGDRPDAVAYLVEDRLITGAALWSDAGAPGGPRTGDALFELPSDTWVYPRRAGEVERALLGDEIGAWRNQHSDRAAPPLEERGFLPVVAGLGEELAWAAPDIGTHDRSGYVDVVPAEALLHRDAFARVVLVADPRSTERSILGAEVRSQRDAIRSASGWDEDEPVLVASEMGELCRSTCRALVHNGIRHVYRLVGGVNLWESCGLPIERTNEHRRRA